MTIREIFRSMTRNATGVPDVRICPLWDKWSAKVCEAVGIVEKLPCNCIKHEYVCLRCKALALLKEVCE